MIRILLAPDSLKGALRATEAAAALAEGVALVGGTSSIELPIGDGGEGTAQALYHGIGGSWSEATVSDALERPVTARLLLLPDGTAVVEAAEAIGIERLGSDELNPMRTTSRGLGELILAAQDLAPRRLLICLGGSATVDGGIGLREALDEALLKKIPAVVACDVDNPLLGRNGAATVFGPQKGATLEMVAELEDRIAAIAELRPYADLPGAGAAGGLGAALAHLGARLTNGAEMILNLLNFDQHAQASDLVVTGEGKVDATTLSGKAVGAVVRHARVLNVPCAVFGGVVEIDIEGAETWQLNGGLDGARTDLVRLGTTVTRKLANQNRSGSPPQD